MYATRICRANKGIIQHEVCFLLNHLVSLYKDNFKSQISGQNSTSIRPVMQWTNTRTTITNSYVNILSCRTSYSVSLLYRKLIILSSFTCGVHLIYKRCCYDISLYFMH